VPCPPCPQRHFRAALLVAALTAGPALAQAVEEPVAPAANPVPAKQGLIDSFISSWHWAGRAPEFEQGDWRFKLRGRLMLDAGATSNPNGALNTDDLGFDARVRRLRIGAEGNLPHNLAYKAEIDFATNEAAWADIYLEWKPDPRWSLKFGNQNSFQSIEQPTSSLDTSFMERAQFVEAYGQGRRVGGSVAYTGDSFFVGTGLYSQSINAREDYAGWLFGARAVFFRQFGDFTGHIGVNFQHREDKDSGVNYRARPNPRLTDIRFVDTGDLAVESDNQLGLEMLAIRGPLHLVAEASWLRARVYRPGDNDEVSPGEVIPARDPDFFGYYLEAGYFFTGESRGYKKAGAIWGPTRVKNPVGRGGYGALSGNVRWDVINLSDDALFSGGVNTDPSRGGRSRQISFSLIWQPIDHVRLTTQYTRSRVKGGPYALEANGLSTGYAPDYGYYLDVIGARLAYDF
jgi:phosphate-selective porin OprO/OprP